MFDWQGLLRGDPDPSGRVGLEAPGVVAWGNPPPPPFMLSRAGKAVALSPDSGGGGQSLSSSRWPGTATLPRAVLATPGHRSGTCFVPRMLALAVSCADRPQAPGPETGATVQSLGLALGGLLPLFLCSHLGDLIPRQAAGGAMRARWLLGARPGQCCPTPSSASRSL